MKAAPGHPAGIYIDSATGSALLAGLERGDRILAVNGIAVATVAEFDAALALFETRGVIALLVMRGGATVYVPVSREGLVPG
jgi:serine protease Do